MQRELLDAQASQFVSDSIIKKVSITRFTENYRNNTHHPKHGVELGITTDLHEERKQSANVVPVGHATSQHH